jgi:potassium-transporting ATPase KdpC subunit
MIREILRAIAACVVTFVVAAVAYPLLVWGLAQVAFPAAAAGSLVHGRDGTIVGSELIAQPFTSDRYFHPRPSAVDYKADAAGGSNLGTNNPDLRAKIEERSKTFDVARDGPAPVELVTASGSGLDPHISPEGARYQARRVAAARGLDTDSVAALIEARVEHSGAMIGAPPRVNVLLLNLDLDAEPTPRPHD